MNDWDQNGTRLDSITNAAISGVIPSGYDGSNPRHREALAKGAAYYDTTMFPKTDSATITNYPSVGGGGNSTPLSQNQDRLLSSAIIGIVPGLVCAASTEVNRALGSSNDAATFVICWGGQCSSNLCTLDGS